MENRIIIVNIPFNIDPHWPNNPYAKTRLTEKWINYRISIFMKYTYLSLKKQTNQNFIALILYDPCTETLIKKALSQYEKLPDNIIFTSTMPKDTIRLINGYEYLYQVRIDSDNMFHPEFIQQLHDITPKPDTQAIINQKGYIYNIATDELATFYGESPAFFTFILKASEVKKGFTYKTEGGHLGVIKLKHEILARNNFMIISHEQNISIRFAKWMYEDLITDENKKNQILKEFNIN